MTPPFSGVEFHSAIRRPVLVFDMDDTLYPELDYMMSGVRQALSSLGFQGSAAAFEAAMLRRFRQGQRTQLMQESFNEIDIPVDEHLMAAFLSAYREQEPSISLSATICSALNRFKSENVDLALISDGDAVRQSRKVEALGLRTWFDPILLTATLGAGVDKSSPAPFEILRERFGEDRFFLFVADNAQKDFIHPLRLGWTSIQIKRKDCVYTTSPPTGVIKVGDEPQMVQQLFRLLEIDA